jgi:hypothetical protein
LSAAQTKDAVFAQFGWLAPQARALYDPKCDASLEALIQAVTFGALLVDYYRLLRQAPGDKSDAKARFRSVEQIEFGAQATFEDANIAKVGEGRADALEAVRLEERLG